MCGRVVQDWPSEAVARLFDATDLVASPGGRYNVAPTQAILGVAERGGRRAVDSYRWGLVPSWAKDPRIGSSMINARAETVAVKPAFRVPFRRQRGIVPVSAFYEWQRQGPRKVPHAIARRDGKPLALAALWSSWRSPEQPEALVTCAIITTEANELMAPIHDRMPVVLGEADWGRWLDPSVTDPEALVDLLRPCPPEWLRAYAVSRLVNDVRNDSRELLEPVAAA